MKIIRIPKKLSIFTLFGEKIHINSLKMFIVVLTHCACYTGLFFFLSMILGRNSNDLSSKNVNFALSLLPLGHKEYDKLSMLKLL